MKRDYRDADISRELMQGTRTELTLLSLFVRCLHIIRRWGRALRMCLASSMRSTDIS